MINLEDRKQRVAKVLDRVHRENVLELIAEIERLQKKAEALYKAASNIVDQIIEDQAFGAEYSKEGLIEVELSKAEVEEFISVILGWDREA